MVWSMVGGRVVRMVVAGRWRSRIRKRSCEESAVGREGWILRSSFKVERRGRGAAVFAWRSGVVEEWRVSVCRVSAAVRPGAICAARRCGFEWRLWAMGRLRMCGCKESDG